MVEYSVQNGAITVRNGAAVARRMIDSFEDASLSEYTDVSGGYYTLVNDATLAVDGEWLVDFQGNAGSASGLNSMSGLPNYPSPGDTIVSHTEFVYGNDFGGIQFGIQNETDAFPDGYRCQIDGGQDRIEIIKQSGGGGTFDTLGHAPLTLSNHLNEPLQHVPHWGTDGVITYTVNDENGNQLAQADNSSNPDTTYTSGGFGFASETNSGQTTEQHVRHDMAYIRP